MSDLNYNKLCNDEPEKQPKLPKKPHPKPMYDNGTAYKKYEPEKNKQKKEKKQENYQNLSN